MDLAGRPLAPARESRTESGPVSPPPVLPQVHRAAATSLDALAEGKSVVVAGASGTGKSTVMARVLAELGDDFSILRLRGAASWSAKPFGGLFWLLSELPPETLSNPVYILQFVRGVLREKAAGHRLVLAIEHAEDLDAVTLSVLLQLCRSDSAVMLATVRDLSSCPGEFVRWWGEDSVHRVDLRPLQPSGTRILLEDLVGAPVSSRLVAEVQARSRGNPRLSSTFLEEQLQARTVVERRGTWIWTGAVSYSGSLAERVEIETAALSSAERYAVDVLALTGGLPLDLLLRIADPAAVERLEDVRLVESSTRGANRFLRLADPLLAEAAATLAPHGRSADIQARLAGPAAVPASAGDRNNGVLAAVPLAVPGTGTGRSGAVTTGRYATSVRAATELSHQGQWAAALHTALTCLDGILHAPAGEGDGEALSGLFCVFLTCGELRHAADLLARADSAVAGMELLGSNDLSEGILQVFAGRADRAVDYLQRAQAQLEEQDPDGLLPLAMTAAAYAYILLGDGPAKEGEHAAAATRSTGSDAGTGTSAAAEPAASPPGPAVNLARCLARLAAVRSHPGTVVESVGEPDAGPVSPTFEPAESSPAASAPDHLPATLLVLAGAALQGSADAARRLGDAAARCTGTAAQMYLDLSRGLAGREPAAVLRAAAAAHRLGQYLIAYEAARNAVLLARERSDRTALRAARRIENASFRMLRAANSVTDRLPDLSDFERKLAAGAAAGESSSQLAAALHLSPRTVDWHLGRIFQKLRVSGRAELRECLETEQQRV